MRGYRLKSADEMMTGRQVIALIFMMFFCNYAASADEFDNRARDYANRADADGDGVVSLHELRAAHYADPEFNRQIEQSFGRLDRNSDGVISADERRHASAKMPTTRQSAPTPAPPVAVAVAPKEPAAATALKLDAQPIRQVENNRTVSRTEAWILEIDADNSGGASAAELLASGGGQPWFVTSDFEAADRNGDGDLDPGELDALVSSLERRRR